MSGGRLDVEAAVIMSRTSQETSAIFLRGQVTLLVRNWRISIHLLVSAFG